MTTLRFATLEDIPESLRGSACQDEGGYTVVVMPKDDDLIVKEAANIKTRRLNAQRLASFEQKETVMIRWDNVGTKFGESYTGIEVPKEVVEDVVRAYFRGLT